MVILNDPDSQLRTMILPWALARRSVSLFPFPISHFLSPHRHSKISLNHPPAVPLPNPLDHELAVLLADWLTGEGQSLEVGSPEQRRGPEDLDGVGGGGGDLDPNPGKRGHERSDRVPPADRLDPRLEQGPGRGIERGDRV